jgi:hypothetical protein
MSQTLDIRVVKKAPASTGMALFSVIRDEDYFLPFFFAHYRALGVETFLVYDDRSGEATKDFLNAQPDCSIVVSDHAFGDIFGVGKYFGPRRLATALRESIPVWAFPTRWVVTADADEFLVLPEDLKDLPSTVAYLDSIGQPYLTAPMVDFYGPTLNHRHYPTHVDPFAASGWFDVGPYYEWLGAHVPMPLPAGVNHRLRAMLSVRDREVLTSIYGANVAPPLAWKAPLLKNGAGVIRHGDHHLSVVPRAELSAALAHFKFYPGLDAKIAMALGEGQYAGGSMHYRFLEAALRLLGDEPLIAAQSRRYEGPLSLARAGLMAVG